MFNIFKKKNTRLIENPEKLYNIVRNIHIYNIKETDNITYPFFIEVEDTAFGEIYYITSKNYLMTIITYDCYKGIHVEVNYDIGNDIIELLEEKILEADKKVEELEIKKRDEAREEILKNHNKN